MLRYYGFCMVVGALGFLFMEALVRLTGLRWTSLVWALVLFTGALLVWGGSLL